MYLWQKPASPTWWNAYEGTLRDKAGSDLVVIEQPGRKRLTLEIPCQNRAQAVRLRRRFGGRFSKLPGDWLKRFTREQKTRPLAIGKRLVIVNAGGTSASRHRGQNLVSGRRGPSHIIVPAGAAFGTGQHATTAMSLRLLEKLTRNWKAGWSLVDLGTGSGIFALAAKRFGAGSIVGIDNDPVAISTAKGNARLNRMDGIRFLVADATRWRVPAGIDVLTANLFSELLIEALPKWRNARRLVLSGVMRNQEREVVNALKEKEFRVITVRRRGKWIAMLVASGAAGV